MEILTRVGLGEHANAYARSLSGGMRRRLLVAKALVHSPPVLVLDEPTAGVDIELRKMMWDYVRELHAAGTTVILTTHYLEEAEAMCDRIAILDHGEVVACEDTPRLLARVDAKTLLLRLASDCTKAPDLRPELGPELRESITVTLRAPDLLALTYSRSRASAPELIAAAQAAGLRITEITTEEPMLEDVFLSLTGAAGAAARA